MTNKKLIAALQKLVVVSDFKTAKEHFVKLGVNPSLVDSYFKKFKAARDQNKIKNLEDKNIDTWADKNNLGMWTAFVRFVDGLEYATTKTEEKKNPWKMPTPEGATKVAENSEWIIYDIVTYEASKKLGTRNWCISRDEHAWIDYTEINEDYPNEEAWNYYFALSKTRSYKAENVASEGHIEYEDAWHRIAIQIDWNGQKRYWNADDKDFSGLPKDVKLPAFKFEVPEAPTILES